MSFQKLLSRIDLKKRNQLDPFLTYFHAGVGENIFLSACALNSFTSFYHPG